MTDASSLQDALGRPVDGDQASAVITTATALVRAYCNRGTAWDSDGFPLPEVDAVILTVALRLLANPRQISMSETRGPESVDYREGFKGFTMFERLILDEHRWTAL